MLIGRFTSKACYETGRKWRRPDQYESLAAIESRCSAPIPAEPIYSAVREQGFEFGHRFRVLRTIQQGSGEALGEVELQPETWREAEDYNIHPVLLDGCVQTIAAAFHRQNRRLIGMRFIYRSASIDSAFSPSRP